MRSKIKIIGFSLLVAFSACNQKSIPNEKAAIPEDQTRQIIEEPVQISGEQADTNRFSDEHIVIQKLIDAGKLTEARKALEKKLYGPGADEAVNYASPAYGGFLNLYVLLLNNLKALENGAKEKEYINLSLNKFFDHFLRECVSDEGTCEYLGRALKNESTVVQIILMIAEKEADPQQKLKLLGAAFDTNNRRKFELLEEMYLQVALEVLTEFENDKIKMSKGLVRKHLRNVLWMTNQVNWGQVNSKKLERYLLIKPWNYDAESGAALDDLRKEMIVFLPAYAPLSQEIREGVKAVISDKLQSLEKQNKDLREYPAYSGVDLEVFNNIDPVVAYLVLGTYFKKIKVTEANSFMAAVQNKSEFVDQAFRAAKMLVRWDVAQLGVLSTERLHWKFSQQDIKTNSFFTETLEWSKSLTPLWNDFHTGRASAIKSFLEAHSKDTSGFSVVDVQEFFTAINHNIMRTTVFPNMLAFAFYMAKTEWSATIRIWWFVFKLDTTLIMDYMMTGQYEYPWFNFTNLKETKGWRMEEKTSLFRSEMYDALYYFFTTKTFKVYDIDPDEFLSLIGETILKERRSLFEKTLTQQKNLYLKEGTPSVYFANWCEGIKQGKYVDENIPFYELSDYITPGNLMIRYNPGELTGPSFYFGDAYREMGSFERLHTTNDRYRLELEPIIYALNQYLKITERVADKHPELQIGLLPEAKKDFKNFELLKLNYLGMQKYLGKKFRDCAFVADQEAKRRVMAVAEAQKIYFSNVVWPLMNGVYKGQISVHDANQTLYDFHGSEQGMFDKIEVSDSGRPIYIASRLTYMLRVRALLISGISFHSLLTNPYHFPAIVGERLKSALPTNFLSDTENNSYIKKASDGDNYYKFYFEDSAEDFSRSVSSKTTDESRASISMRSRFTEWDQHDIRKYVTDLRYNLEYEVTMLQIPEQKFTDVSRPGCLTSNLSEYKDECIVVEKADIYNVVKVARDILGVYAIDEEQEEYLALILRKGWVGTDALDTPLKFDLSMPLMDYESGMLPYNEIAGLLDMAVEMLSSHYLGLTFVTPYHVELNKGNSHMGDLSCEAKRNGCYWKNEVYQALEFFISRAKRPRMIFNYDLQIVEDDFKYHEKLSMDKYNRVIEIEDRSVEFLDFTKETSRLGDEVLVSMFKAPSPLVPLSRNYLNYRREFEKFFKEETEGFYLEEHNWNNYIIQ